MPLACSAADFTVGGGTREVNNVLQTTCSPWRKHFIYTQPSGCIYERLFVAEIEVPFITPYLNCIPLGIVLVMM